MGLWYIGRHLTGHVAGRYGAGIGMYGGTGTRRYRTDTGRHGAGTRILGTGAGRYRTGTGGWNWDRKTWNWDGDARNWDWGYGIGTGGLELGQGSMELGCGVCSWGGVSDVVRYVVFISCRERSLRIINSLLLRNSFWTAQCSRPQPSVGRLSCPIGHHVLYITLSYRTSCIICHPVL